MKILMCKFNDLTKEEQEEFYDDGHRNYLVIEWNPGKRDIYTDGMEPEDATFARDLYWIIPAIEKAYRLGLENGKSLSSN